MCVWFSSSSVGQLIQPDKTLNYVNLNRMYSAIAVSQRPPKQSEKSDRRGPVMIERGKTGQQVQQLVNPTPFLISHLGSAPFIHHNHHHPNHPPSYPHVFCGLLAQCCCARFAGGTLHIVAAVRIGSGCTQQNNHVTLR